MIILSDIGLSLRLLLLLPFPLLDKFSVNRCNLILKILLWKSTVNNELIR